MFLYAKVLKGSLSQVFIRQGADSLLRSFNT